MNVNPFGSSSIYTNSTPSTMNANQSCGLRFGASSDDYDYYNSSVPKKKESFWQKWKKVIIGTFVTVGVGILGVVGYNKGWFSKAKNVATNGPSQTKPNNFKTALKTLGLSDSTIQDGTKIADLLKKPNEVNTSQFTEVVGAVKTALGTANDSSKAAAAVTILEQLRKNLANKNEKIGNFDLKSEINDIDVLNEILKEAKKVEEKEVIPTEEEKELEEKEKKAKQPVQLEQPEQLEQLEQPEQSAESVQPESTSQNTTDLNNDIDSTPTDISVPPVQPTKSPTEAQELRERTQETEKKKVEEQLKNKGLNDDVIVALLDDKKAGKNLQTIIENTVPIANRLTNLIDKTPNLKDNAAFKSLVTSFLTTVNENDKLLEDKNIRNNIAELLDIVMQDRNHFGINKKHILNPLVKKVCSISEKSNVIENATYKTINCLATYIEKGVINGALAFAPNAITDTNVCDIANILTINYNKLNKNKSLVTSFLTAVNEKKDEFINQNSENITQLLETFCKECNQTDNVASEPKLYKVIDALKKRINSTSLTNIENWLKHCESAAFTPINVISVSDDEVTLAEKEFIRKYTLPDKALNEYNKDELVLYINTYLSSINCLSIDNKKVQSMNQQQLFEVARSIQKHEVFIKNNSAKLGEEKNVLYNNEIIRYCNDHNTNNPIWNNCSYIEDSENVSKNHGCWKMHIYIDREDDYQKIAPIIIEYFRTENLKNHSVENKTLRHISPELFQLYSFSQGSKGFTIYPPYNPENKDNVESMEKIAKDLDKLIREHNLTISKSEIPGDRQMGKTGRLFYRYEYASIKYKNKEYSSDLYDVNRANKNLKYAYLPQDGQDQKTYDPWFNFDPADDDSHPKIEIQD